MRKLLGCCAVLLIGLMGFGQFAMAQQGLSASLEPSENGVVFHLTNDGNSTVSILRWETPLEDELTQDIFAVVPMSYGKPDRFGKRAIYKGRMLKRGKPEASDYLVLKPGETVSREVALADYYDLADDGLHTAQYTGSLIFESQSFAKRTVHSHRTTKAGRLETEAVAVNLVVPPERSFARAGGFNSCSADQQAQLPADLDASEQITLQALADMQSLPESERPGSPRYVKWFGTYSAQRYNSVVQTYENAAARTADGSIEFNCGCDERIFAYVFRVDPFKIYLCNLYWAADRTGTDSRAGTILHELTHFNEVAGTDDLAYGAVSVANLARNNPAGAVNNADSIEYFAENTPFEEISAGDTVAPQPDNFQPLQLGALVSDSVALNESVFFEVTGADFVELTTVSGDADLFIYATPARNNVLCSSESTGNTDRCDISSASTAYIQVFGHENSSFNVIAEPIAPAQSETLPVGETLTRFVSRGEDQFFVVSGAGIIEIESLTGDADLYVHSDAARTLETCRSLAFSEASLVDSCELSGGTSYITVNGFTDANYSVVASEILTVAPQANPVDIDSETTGDTVTVPVTDTNSTDTDTNSTDTDDVATINIGDPIPDSTSVTGFRPATADDVRDSIDDSVTPIVTTQSQNDSNQGANSTGGSSGGASGLGLIAMLAAMVLYRRRSLIAFGGVLDRK